MPAPKGNKFNADCKGRPKILGTPEECRQKVEDYFTAMDNDPIMISEVAGKDPTVVLRPQARPYTFEGLALFLGVRSMTLRNYESEDGYEDYFEIFSYARERINNQNLSFGMAGIYNPKIVSLVLGTNSTYREKTQQEINLKTEFKVGFDDEPESE